MMFSFEQMLALVGLTITWAGIMWGIIKWMLGRIDRVSVTSTRAHARIDELDDKYVKRQEVMEHFRRIEEAVEKGRTDTNLRLDRLYELLLSDKK